MDNTLQERNKQQTCSNKVTLDKLAIQEAQPNILPMKKNKKTFFYWFAKTKLMESNSEDIIKGTKDQDAIFSQMRPKIEYCYHIWDEAAQSSLACFDKSSKAPTQPCE